MNASPSRTIRAFTAFGIIGRCTRILRAALRPLAAELRHLNSYALHGPDANLPSHRARAAKVREALSRSYRDRSPCC